MFTSSAGVYAVQSGECTEDSPLAEMGSSARTDKLRKAEQAALDAGAFTTSECPACVQEQQCIKAQECKSVMCISILAHQ